MSDHDHATHASPPDAPPSVPGFWRSRTGTTLIVFLAVGAVLLGYEHRVHLFAGDVFVAVLLLGCIVMHFFMHGSHGGGSGGHGTGGTGDKP